METTKWEKSCYLEYYPKSSKSPKIWAFNTGKYTLGFPWSHIIIKDKNQVLEPVSFLVEIKDDSSAILTHIDKPSDLFDGRRHILKNGDRFALNGNVFRFMNNLLQIRTQDFVTSKRRQFVTPSFKTKAKRRRCVKGHRRRTRIFKAKSLTHGGNKERSVKTYKHKHSEKDYTLNLSMSHPSDSSVSDESWLTIRIYDSASTSTTPNDLTRDPTLWRTPETPSSPHSMNANGLKTNDILQEPLLTLSISDSSDSPTLVWPSFSSDESVCLSTTLIDLTRDTKLFRTSESSTLVIIDLTNVSSLKTKAKSPKKQKSPKNDLMDISGIDKLFKTPKAQKSPKNDLSDVRRVKKTFQTPKPHKSPKNDLSDVRGVKKIFQTPKPHKSPKNDLSDVRGVKKIFQTPKPHKSPNNDLSDASGLEKLFKTPKIQNNPRGIRNVEAEENFNGRRYNTRRAGNKPDVAGLENLFKMPYIQNSPRGRRNVEAEENVTGRRYNTRRAENKP